MKKKKPTKSQNEESQPKPRMVCNVVNNYLKDF